jgi:hypothetical protein
VLRALREWMCLKVGHDRVLIGSGRVKCRRCGNIRPLRPEPGDPAGLLMQEYGDEVDPDPMP